MCRMNVRVAVLLAGRDTTGRANHQNNKEVFTILLLSSVQSTSEGNTSFMHTTGEYRVSMPATTPHSGSLSSLI